MTRHPFAIVCVLAAVTFGHGALRAEARDPTADCLANAATSSIDPYPCDLALEIARSNADTWAIAAAHTNRGLILERAGRLNLALQDQDAAVTLLQENPTPTEEEVRFGMAGNLCRCTGYQNIVKAILASADMLNAQKEAAE